MLLIPVDFPSSKGFPGKEDLSVEEGPECAEGQALSLLHLERLLRQP